MFCLACHKTAMARTDMPGNILAEIILWPTAIVLTYFFGWMCLIAPAAFSLYRMIKRKSVCQHCGSTALVLPDSSEAQIVKKKILADALPSEVVS